MMRARKPKPSAPLEKDIQRAILDYLEHHPSVLVWRMNTGAMERTNAAGRKRFVRFGRPGQADITGILRPWGIRLEIEVKRPGGEPTRDQIEFCDAVQSAGGVYFVVHSVEEAKRQLDATLRALRERDKR